MKKLVILILFIGLPIMIYLLTIDNKIYYVALGDSLAVGQTPYNNTSYGYADYVADHLKEKNKLAFYTKQFAVSSYRITDLIHDINTNREITVNSKKITIKHALTEADVVTISVGINELFYKLGINNLDSGYYSESDLKKYVDEVVLDTEKLIILTKKYCKEDIILIGYYNPLWHMKKTYAQEMNSIFVYANDEMKRVSKDYDLYYVDIHKLFEENNDFLPNPLDIHPSNEGYSAIAKEIDNIIDKNVLK